MYAWEKPFEKVVELARKNEINCITSASYLRGVYLSFMVFTERLTLYITLLSYSLFGYQVTADIVSISLIYLHYCIVMQNKPIPYNTLLTPAIFSKARFSVSLYYIYTL